VQGVDPAARLTFYDKVQKQGRDASSKEKGKRTTPSAKRKAGRAKSLEPRVREIVAAQDKQGRWVTNGHSKRRDWEFDERVETAVFIKNLETLAAYLDAVR
jgi:hypothetical protein